jgi:two-component system phosphate regulon sensor histidine kinase PhoR
MNKKMIVFIVVLTCLSLVGIVITQLFYVRNALSLKEEQFDHRVSIALKSVVNQLADYKKDTSKITDRDGCEPGCSMRAENIITVINPDYLDSVIKEEFSNLDIFMDYNYGVFKKTDNSFIMGDYGNFKNEILKSNHSSTLSCLWKPDCYILSIYFPDEKNSLLGQMTGWIVLSALFLLIFVVCFSYVMLSLVKQKKLSEMKTDFVNNMTHEFKTPIATISLASEMLLKPNINQSPERTEKYANIIYDENNRLKNQVEQVLQIAVLDKGNFKLRKKEINMHEIIGLAVDNFEMIVKQRCGKINVNLGAEMSTLYADQIHISNIINNLMDNANKYSPETPEITISTRNTDKGIVVSVEDKGIGISHENQKHIFRKFFRVHTGNIHDVKGFGLGLYYVKTIVDAHGGTIELHSELKKGTRIEIYFPFIQN